MKRKQLFKKHKCLYNRTVECVANDVPKICPCCQIMQEWTSKIANL